MNKEQKLERIRKNGKITATVARVLEIVAIVGAVLSAAGAILLAFFDPAKAGVFVDFGPGDSFAPWQVWLMDNFEDKTGFILMCVALVAVCAVLAAVMYLVRKTFLTLTDGDTPFRPQVVKYLKVIAVLLTLAALSESLGAAVITGFAAWTVVLIFEYGCALQDESDEII